MNRIEEEDDAAAGLRHSRGPWFTIKNFIRTSLRHGRKGRSRPDADAKMKREDES
jgi:hypothetical protein